MGDAGQAHMSMRLDRSHVEIVGGALDLPIERRGAIIARFDTRDVGRSETMAMGIHQLRARVRRRTIRKMPYESGLLTRRPWPSLS
jgi:hypothetical protein